ncbi:MAG: DUF4390 domain-containing protein, partial [Syntrophales bacterium]|nr:DUF4390 domain-containing protein [Syntrophales bacterium]
MDDTRDILVYARAQDFLKEGTERLIYAGVTVRCTFYVNFYQKRPYWFDRRLSDQVVRNAVKYDNIKKTIYVTVRLDEKEMETSEFHDVGSAEHSLIELSGVPVFEVGRLNKAENYYVRIKAKIEKDDHSRFIRYIMVVLPFMESETGWYRK